MVQIVDMSHSEKVAMYDLIEKPRLIEMLIEANRVIEQLTNTIPVNVYDTVPYMVNHLNEELNQLK